MIVQCIDWPSEWSPLSIGDDIVDAAPRLAAHQDHWMNSLCDGFGHRGFLLRAIDDDDVVGLLPLVLVSGPIFGKFLVSLPYLNTGGVWARSTDAALALIDRACDLADELDVKHLELRHEQNIEHPKFNFQRTDKVHMRLDLPATDEDLERMLKSKVRSQIRKSNEHHLSVEFGKMELVDDFHNVFARNMRDLGTPVFSKKLFQSIINHFADDAEFCVVRQSGRTIASGLLIHTDGCTEVPSASSLRSFNRTNANMLMYRSLLRRAIERGSQTFDFGRSSVGSGTYKFKSQWGAGPHAACWQYYVRKGDPNDMRPDAGGKQRLVKIWQRLPVWLTKTIGPTIVRGIP
ncbi:FemAB family protein [Rubripirellula obstinata]|uniref:FemAB family protein n=1 Tax=Rubripirellula obstinata TaxID=406547 RepID=A0A5B1CNZ6_9BACT|nr:FemAB family XrtA/PEP-CTERM system-associated protein [Rubripirellula obstinata]KAA1261014.1 FemAB family protein [Rubripirellula obstinata]